MQLLQNNHDVVILDNLCNSKRSVLPVIERLGGKAATFIDGDIRDEALLREIFHDYAIDTVIHFAGLKAVGESVAKPLEYYDNNVNGTLRLISAMRAAGVTNFIFSSSATVYGDQPKIPYVESFPTGTPQSPYGKSKLMVEQILTDLQKACPEWSIALLRYFNPVGAHPSGDMGEDPQGIPNNLMPYIAQVAVGRRESLAVFGNDYPTKDGTGVRDYIHVMDLADGHVARRPQGIVRALVKHPTLLILDEPLQGLDPLNRQLVRRFVDVLISEGETQLLFVSHHAEDAPQCMTHRLTFIPDGDSYRYQFDTLR
ncbi:UDP-N-acetylglucosamine 4-epimerase / UDP-glucose 4-epimerase [Cronobacter sakazakii 701]|nr:UDP-N-acetylglucosamine 4-epimerase / UDP-glucose 4-epimerase [Cronobacter sakazakii 701]